MKEEILSSIKRHGKKLAGRTELIKHLNGQKLTRSQAMKAKCYECLGYFADGIQDCKMPECPLYQYFWLKDDRDKG